MRSLVFAFAATALVHALPAQRMYFLGNGNGPDDIRRANLDGSNVQVLVPAQTSPQAIALDLVHGAMYWTDSGVVRTAGLDGSNARTIVPGLSLPRGVAVDAAGGKVYWAQLAPAKIQRANLDGTNVQDLVTTGLNAPTPVALDGIAGKIYWIDVNADRIQRANLDGSQVEDVLLQNDGWGLAIDPVAGHMYWTATNAIRRANLDGSNVVTLVSGLSWARGIALDTVAGQMYWSDGSANRIQRANLDGSNVQNLLTSGLDTILSLALELGPCAPASWVNYGAGWPGALGVPALSALSQPVLGALLTLQIGSSSSSPTSGALLVDTQSGSFATPFGGTILIGLSPQSTVIPLALSPAGTQISAVLPTGNFLCGAAIYAQSLVLDPAASQGLSFSAGLELRVGR